MLRLRVGISTSRSATSAPPERIEKRALSFSKKGCWRSSLRALCSGCARPEAAQQKRRSTACTATPNGLKFGSVFRYDTFSRGYEFVCKASWTLAAWQMRKLSTREAKKEVIFNRDQVENSLSKIRDAHAAEIEQWMRSEKVKAQAELEAPGSLRPFKAYPKVEDWRGQYLKRAMEQCCRTPSGTKLTRFKFLVLCGDSRWGKTRFGCNIFGCANTFVAQCQGVSQPCLAGYDPRFHRAILLDEPGPDLVASCKVFLQAAIEGTDLYQSPTQRFSRWVWVYGVPIIICTNDWLEAKDDSKLACWIHANQVLVEVNEAMWIPDPNEPVPRASRELPFWFDRKRLLK